MALTDPLVKLIEAFRAAIGTAYQPHHHMKMTEAEVYRISELSKTIRENGDLPIQYNGSELKIDMISNSNIVQRAGNRLAYQEIYKQQNLEAIGNKAYDVLQEKGAISDETVSPDWMNRFINLSGEISTDEMQEIWAKVIAGEVINPGSYSMKTLECLRNMSDKDARLFEKVSKYIISDRLLFADIEINMNYGITYDDILCLDEIGLINSSSMITLMVDINEEPLFDFGKYIVWVRKKNVVDSELKDQSDSENMLSIRQFPLSRAGRELLSIARKTKYGDIGEDYIKDVVDNVCSSNPNKAFMIRKVRFRDEKSISYEWEREWSDTVFD